jgi:hypothetical protein
MCTLSGLAQFHAVNALSRGSEQSGWIQEAYNKGIVCPSEVIRS